MADGEKVQESGEDVQTLEIPASAFLTPDEVAQAFGTPAKTHVRFYGEQVVEEELAVDAQGFCDLFDQACAGDGMFRVVKDSGGTIVNLNRVMAVRFCQV